MGEEKRLEKVVDLHKSIFVVLLSAFLGMIAFLFMYASSLSWVGILLVSFGMICDVCMMFVILYRWLIYIKKLGEA